MPSFSQASPNPPRLLNLGCGDSYHPDWVNLDFHARPPHVAAHDLATPLPFADDAFDAVYHSHVLEHLSPSQAPVFLGECLRVLRPGGTLRVAVPDLAGIVGLYLEALEGALAGDKAAEDRYDWMMLELFDQMTRDVPGGEMLAWLRRTPMPAQEFVYGRVGPAGRRLVERLRADGEPKAAPPARAGADGHCAVGRFRAGGEIHRWMYDRFSLGRLLERTGFREIRTCSAFCSSIAGFDAYRLDVEADATVRKPDSLYMEAFK